MPNLFNSANYPVVEPGELIIGDRWAWKRKDLNADYPNTGHTLKYSARLETDGSYEIQLTATADNGDYLIEVSQSDTISYAAGVYHWQAYITRNADSERITIGNGAFEIKANRDVATTDPRSQAKIVLDAIEAVIAGRATKDQESYSVQGRSLARTPIPELLVLRDTYRAEVFREEQARKLKAGEDPGRFLHTRF